MIDLIKNNQTTPVSARVSSWLRNKASGILKRFNITSAAVIISLMAAVFWLVIASDLYVSDAHVIIERTELASGQSMDFAGLLGGAINSGRADQLLLRDHLLSVDMLKKIDATLNLRAHFSDKRRDLISRMWFQDDPIELFYEYYLSKVSIEFDDYAGVLIIKALAYDPKTAYAITSLLVQEGERFMNETAHKLAQDQVAFLEKQVSEMDKRVIQARQDVLNYQNKKGLISPQATTESIAGIIAKLEAELTDLETQRRANLAYLVPSNPSILQMSQQIDAVKKQIKYEQDKLASTKGKTLNLEVEEFQLLEMKAAFAQDLYKTALVALEKGRIEATRTIKKVTVLQSPILPEYPLEPRRAYNTLVFFIVAMMLAGVVHLLTAIIRDHKD